MLTRVWIWVGAGVLLLALVAAGIATVILRDDATPTGASPITPSDAASPAAASSGAASPAVPGLSGQDPCVVGTWTETSSRASGKIDGVRVELVGSGTVQEFHADGTGTVRHANIARRGTAGGHTYEIVDNFALTFTWRTSNGQITYGTVRGSGTRTWKVDGVTRSSAPLDPEGTTERYTCDADRMTQRGADYTIELTRSRSR